MLLAVLKKEILLTLRDIHALAVLFAMPVAFILVMSLALQETDKEQQQQFDVGLVFQSQADQQAPESGQLKTSGEFKYIEYADYGSFKDKAESDQLIAGVIVPQNFFSKLLADDDVTLEPVEIYYQPTTPLPLRKLLLASLRQSIATIQLEKRLAKEIEDPFIRKGMRDKFLAKNLMIEKEITGTGEEDKVQPTSVQQSVPAWLIFSMFFVVIPIATTVLIEKQNGTHQRLMTLPVSDTYLLLGKLIPYLFINIIQTVLMFLVGIYLVPLFGGNGLVLSDNAWLLIPMSLSVGLAAISLALLIATFVKSTEQATTIGGVINLLLAAIGGIMVPVYVMPDFMQQAASYSPMNWGLDGFLTILLREGQWTDITTNMIKLLALALVLFVLALFNYRRVVASS
jgi:ABC-2 type transport system permease protein